MAAKIRRDDTVMVMTGKDRGKTGKVREVRPSAHRIVVEGINLVKRHTKPRGVARQGGIIEQEAALDVSNVALVCDRCGPTRIGFREAGESGKERYCKKCGEGIPETKPQARAS